VEGSELDVLQGAAHVLRRDQPVFGRAIPTHTRPTQTCTPRSEPNRLQVLTVELHVLREPAYTHQLMQLLASAGYRALLVDEVCGKRSDCRNLLALPLSRSASFAGLGQVEPGVIERALVIGSLRTVNATSIAGHVIPCCALGLPCAHPHIGFPDVLGRCCNVGRAQGSRLQPPERPRSRGLPPCDRLRNYSIPAVSRADRLNVRLPIAT
jgi:hypothetical protein